MWWLLIPVLAFVLYWIMSSAKSLPFWKKAQEYPDLFIEHCTQTDGWYIYVRGDKPESTEGLVGPFVHSSGTGIPCRVYIDAARIEELQRGFLQRLPGN